MAKNHRISAQNHLGKAIVFTHPFGQNPYKQNSMVFALLEKVFLFAMVVAKEGYGVGHHPDVASATVIVRFVPLTILSRDGDNQRLQFWLEPENLAKMQKILKYLTPVELLEKWLHLIANCKSIFFLHMGFTAICQLLTKPCKFQKSHQDIWYIMNIKKHRQRKIALIVIYYFSLFWVRNIDYKMWVKKFNKKRWNPPDPQTIWN